MITLKPLSDYQPTTKTWSSRFDGVLELDWAELERGREAIISTGWFKTPSFPTAILVSEVSSSHKIEPGCKWGVISGIFLDFGAMICFVKFG